MAGWPELFLIAEVGVYFEIRGLCIIFVSELLCRGNALALHATFAVGTHQVGTAHHILTGSGTACDWPGTITNGTTHSSLARHGTDPAR